MRFPGWMAMKKKLGVFDFDGEEEPVDITPGKFKKKEKCKKKSPEKKKNSRSGDDYSPVDKYNFLQLFTRGTKIQTKDLLNDPVDVDDTDKAVQERISVSDTASQSSSSQYRAETYSGPKNLDSRTLDPASDFNTSRALEEATGRDSALPHFPLDSEPVRINSHDDHDFDMSSKIPSYGLADTAGPSGGKVLEHGVSECDIEQIVVLSPEHVYVGIEGFCKPQLAFSCSCIKLTSAANGINGTFTLEWKTADLVKIESKWCEKSKTANVCLHLKSKHTKVADDAKTSGTLELMFAVSDPHWSKKEEAIKLLDVKYIDKWKVDLEFEESFEEVIYPEGDPDAVSISKRDIELLQPERFINDTIVDFYIQYLKSKVKPEDRDRFHFFNSFFFRKLADFDSNRSKACRGREAFQRARKWTKKVNLFEKHYVFIPVNFSLHWSLVIICHPGEVVHISDEETEKLVKLPCILHMDSIKGSHRGLKNLIQSYLLEEWKDRSTDPAEDVSSKFLNLRFFPLELPQQRNSFDCGLFLLHYMELFVEQAPVNFSPFKMLKSSRFLKKDWFPPAEASLKRGHIKNLINEIAQQNLRAHSSACHENCSSESSNFSEEVTEEVPQEAYESKETCDESHIDTKALLRINLTPVAAKPLRSVYMGEYDILEFPESGDKGSPTDGNDRPFGQMVLRNQLMDIMSPIEEGEETSEQTACSPAEVSGLQLALTTEPSVKNIRPLDTFWPLEMLPDSKEFENGDQISGASRLEYSISSSPEKADVYECSSASSDERGALVVKDSQEETGDLDASVCEIYHCQRRLFAPQNQKASSSVEVIAATSHVPPVAPSTVEDSQEEIEELGTSDGENYWPRRRLFDSFNQEANSSIGNTDVAANQLSPMSYFEEVRACKRPRRMSTRQSPRRASTRAGKRATRSLSEGIQEIVIL